MQREENYRCKLMLLISMIGGSLVPPKNMIGSGTHRVPQRDKIRSETIKMMSDTSRQLSRSNGCIMYAN